jgi:predicted DCC family thiol-disulfide oxidoreductase YuxK
MRDVILIDGTCIFCNRLVAFILRRDTAGRYAFAHLQSDFARGALERHGLEPDIDAIYLLHQPGAAGERLLVDGQVGREIWPRLLWFALPIRWVPLALLNLGYRAFAKIRYRLFGQYPSCHVPSEAERARFLS